MLLGNARTWDERGRNTKKLRIAFSTASESATKGRRIVDTVATAIADRLVYNSQVLILEGPSYRKRNNTAE